MAGYTITITPTNDDSGAQTTIQVDTASGSARITELTVRAADGGGMSAHQLSAVNLDALIAALSPTTQSTPPVITASASTVRPHVVAEADAGASEPVPAASGRARKSARKTAAKKASSRTRQAKAEKAATGATATGRRAYRRMPEASEVLDAYRQVGGTTALARHFGVPRHTATGWLRRLRSMGELDS